MIRVTAEIRPGLGEVNNVVPELGIGCLQDALNVKLALVWALSQWPAPWFVSFIHTCRSQWCMRVALSCLCFLAHDVPVICSRLTIAASTWCRSKLGWTSRFDRSCICNDHSRLQQLDSAPNLSRRWCDSAADRARRSSREDC